MLLLCLLRLSASLGVDYQSEFMPALRANGASGPGRSAS